MEYPLISEYLDAILSAEDNFNKLSSLRPALDSKGKPIMSIGNFSVVFKMKNVETDKLYAVKCFTHEQEEREERYKEIIETIKNVHSKHIVSTQYLDKELLVDTAQRGAIACPIVVMDWVEGVSLDEYLRHIEGNTFKKELLANEFQKFVCWLLPKPFAHGELKPDNIIIKEDGSIVLVDYDGMFVPALYGKPALETGTPMFQYKGRNLSDFNEYIDDYAAVLFLLILKVNAITAVDFGDYLTDNVAELIRKFEPYLSEKSIAPLLSAYIMVSAFGRIDRQQLYCLLADNTGFDYKKETELLYAARKGDSIAMINLGDLYRKGVYVPRSDSKAMQWYELAQRLGNVEATCRLCKCYSQGEDFVFTPKSVLFDSLEKQKIDFAYCRKGEDYFLSGISGSKDDFLKAAYWLEKAAKAGNTGAQSWMATLYKEGRGVKKNSNKAEYWLKKAADAGNATAQYHLGNNYAKTEKNFKKAIYWWEKAAANGDFFAQYQLAICYEEGNVVKKDLAKSVYWLQQAAEIGYTKETLYKLAICYEKGLGVEKDLKKSIFWLQKAAYKGNSEAQNKLGLHYYFYAKDFEKAFYWFQKAAEAGQIDAQVNLGFCYDFGFGVEMDEKKAAYWLTKGAMAGDPTAQFGLGVYYKEGCGVEKDPSKAAYWFQKAAEAGNPKAQNNLGDCYKDGIGVEKDLDKAVFWYQKAAEAGIPEAQKTLGYCYENGIGVEKDLDKATYWYEKSEEATTYIKDPNKICG